MGPACCETQSWRQVALQSGAVRVYDIDGCPNLPMLCQIVANVLPRLLPLGYSFALIDEAKHRFSGDLELITTNSADVRTIDSMIARGGGGLLH